MQFHQDTNGVFHQTKTNISQIYLEPQKVLNSHCNFEREEPSWRNHATQYQTKIQGHSN